MKPVILVGLNPRTRGRIPWDSDAEIWTLNEAPANAWLRRYDVLFQLHPRQDWERPNNVTDPNHPLYIKAKSGPCIYCKGAGVVELNGQQTKCRYCKEGTYVLPEHRDGKAIMMQEYNADVPGCMSYPLPAMIDFYCADKTPYFTSTVAHMIVYAMHLIKLNKPELCRPAMHGEYNRIELYGFEAESNTEYGHQRPCIEYWIGYGRALGIEIEAPGSGLVKGPHYAYESNIQAYRTRLELRRNHLQMQLSQAEAEALKAEGALASLTPFKGVTEIAPAFDQRFDDHFRKKSFVSFLRGTIKEVENAIRLYDAYHQEGPDAETNAANLINLLYELG